MGNRNSTLIIYGCMIGVVLLLLYIFMPEGIVIEPVITASEYLASKPHVLLFNKWIVIVPTSTLFVYLLGIQILMLGYLFTKKGMSLWGISFLFWGIGTILAGTSYQGLGYELKCNGNAYCQFTSWFELSYLFVTAISISIMTLAFRTRFTTGKARTYLGWYAKGALVLYTVILLLGSILEHEFLISYELFTVFFMPLFVVFFVVNIRNYKHTQNILDKKFIILWLLFLFVNVAYYAYYLPGLTQTLYTNTGIWFSANDVLHIGLIGWFLYIQFGVMNHMTE